MSFTPAQVTDILRCTQKDDIFIKEMQDNVQSIFNLFGIKSYNNPRFGATLSKLWYYLMTSGSNLQTLGEEYSGIVRINTENRVPSQMMQLLWIILNVGGDEIFEKFLIAANNKINSSRTLTVEAKTAFAKLLKLYQSNKDTIKRIHHLIFLMHGKYYYIASRILDLRYVLVRSWLLNESFNQSFRILGQVSLLFTLFNLVQQVLFFKNSPVVTNGNSSLTETSSRLFNCKMCVLCGDLRKNTSATPCGHIFCWECIFDSLQYQEKCPICRERVGPSRIFLLQNYI